MPSPAPGVALYGGFESWTGGFECSVGVLSKRWVNHSGWFPININLESWGYDLFYADRDNYDNYITYCHHVVMCSSNLRLSPNHPWWHHCDIPRPKSAFHDQNSTICPNIACIHSIHRFKIFMIVHHWSNFISWFEKLYFPILMTISWYFPILNINHGITKNMIMAIHHAGQFWEKWRISLRRHRQKSRSGPWFVTDLYKDDMWYRPFMNIVIPCYTAYPPIIYVSLIGFIYVSLSFTSKRLGFFFRPTWK